MKADGTNLTPLTPFDQQVFDFHPNFSPDGTSVAFTSLSREGVINGAYVMAADGTGVRPITPPELGMLPGLGARRSGWIRQPCPSRH